MMGPSMAGPNPNTEFPSINTNQARVFSIFHRPSTLLPKLQQSMEK